MLLSQVDFAPNLHLRQSNLDLGNEQAALHMSQISFGSPEERVRGVSSFGFSGTNAHTVLGELGSQGTGARRRQACCAIPTNGIHVVGTAQESIVMPDEMWSREYVRVLLPGLPHTLSTAPPCGFRKKE